MKFDKSLFFLFPPLLAQQAAQAFVEVDDASRLNATQVSEVRDIRTENDIRLALVTAHAAHKGISIAGIRHSMGGQTFAKGNIVLNMLPLDGLSYDAESRILTVQSGASWRHV